MPGLQLELLLGVGDVHARHRQVRARAIDGDVVEDAGARAERILQAAGIDPSARGETLDITQYVRIAEAARDDAGAALPDAGA